MTLDAPEVLDRLRYLRELEAQAAARRAADEAAKYPTPGDLACTLDRRIVQRDHLRLIDDAFARLAAGQIDRIAIFTPPQVGKSVRAAVWAPFWWLTRNPTHRIVVASYGAALAASRGRAVRNLVRDHGARFGLELNTDNHAVSDWSLRTGGGMVTAGVGGGLTGRSADIGIMDDVIRDRADADSPLIREVTAGWYSSVFTSRLAPSAPVIYIGTLWNPDELILTVLAEEGTLAEGGRWHILRMPAIADDPADPLGRPLGGPLPHPRIGEGDTDALTAHWADKRRTSLIRDWTALYMCNPVPVEGALVTRDLLAARRHYRDLPEAVTTAVAIDPSGGGRDVAGIIGGFLGTDSRLYLTDDASGVMPSDRWAEAACLLAHRIGADRAIAEVNYGGDLVRLALRTAWERLAREGHVAGMPPRIVEVRSKKGKLLRSEPIAQQWIEDRIRTATYMPELENEWATFKPTSTDSPGRLDASVHLAFQLLPVPGANTLVSTATGQTKTPTGASALARTRITR